MWAFLRYLFPVMVGSIGLALMGCNSGTDAPSSLTPQAGQPVPHDGIRDRPGTDVTGRPGRSAEPTREDLPKIVAFGDSLTAGFGVPPDESYPAVLQRKLNEAGYRYRVVNAGVSGDTTAGGLRRVEWVLKSRPQIVIVELGGNDGLRGLPIEQIRANLERIVQRLQEAGVTVLLAGMQLPPNYGADYTGRFAAMYEELARKYGVANMPFFLEGVGAQAALNQPDGIHPTGAGYRIIVEHLLPVLEPLLTKTPRAMQEIPMA